VETLLDKVREGELTLGPDVVDVVLAASDFLTRALAGVEAELHGAKARPAMVPAPLIGRVRAAAAGERPAPSPETVPAPATSPVAPPAAPAGTPPAAETVSVPATSPVASPVAEPLPFAPPPAAAPPFAKAAAPVEVAPSAKPAAPVEAAPSGGGPARSAIPRLSRCGWTRASSTTSWTWSGDGDRRSRWCGIPRHSRRSATAR